MPDRSWNRAGSSALHKIWENAASVSRNGHPFLSWFLTLLLATGALAGGFYWIASNYLNDLLDPSSRPKQSSSSEVSSGESFSDDDLLEEGKVPPLVGKVASSVKNNKELSRRYEIDYVEKYNDKRSEERRVGKECRL